MLACGCVLWEDSGFFTAEHLRQFGAALSVCCDSTLCDPSRFVLLIQHLQQGFFVNHGNP